MAGTRFGRNGSIQSEKFAIRVRKGVRVGERKYRYDKKADRGINGLSENTITGKFNVGAIIGHNSGTFDKEGFTGSHYVTYTRYDGFIFGWGAYDNGTYLFANYHYRVGKQD